MEISSLSSSLSMAQRHQEMFQKADANGDGGITLEEFESVGKKMPSGVEKPAGAPSAEEMFAELDSDGDGVITEEEHAEGMSKMPPPPPPFDAETGNALLQLQEQSGTDSLADLLASLSEEDEEDTSVSSVLSDEEDEDSSTTAASSIFGGDSELASKLQELLKMIGETTGSSSASTSTSDEALDLVA